MAKRCCTVTAEEVLDKWDKLGNNLEMESSDEMSDDNQLTFLEEYDELDDLDEPIMLQVEAPIVLLNFTDSYDYCVCSLARIIQLHLPVIGIATKTYKVSKLNQQC